MTSSEGVRLRLVAVWSLGMGLSTVRKSGERSGAMILALTGPRAHILWLASEAIVSLGAVTFENLVVTTAGPFNRT